MPRAKKSAPTESSQPSVLHVFFERLTSSTDDEAHLRLLKAARKDPNLMEREFGKLVEEILNEA